MSDHLPESSLAFVLAEQGMYHQKGLWSQNDWLKTTQKLIPSPQNPRLRARGRAVLLRSLTLLLSTWVSFPNKISCFVSTCVSSDNSFSSVRQEPSFGSWKGSSFLQHSCQHFILPSGTILKGCDLLSPFFHKRHFDSKRVKRNMGINNNSPLT